MKLYTYEIDVDTLKIEENVFEEEDLYEEYTGFAEYEESLDGNRVYAESLVNRGHAKKLVLDFCRKFAKCVKKMEKKNDRQK